MKINAHKIALSVVGAICISFGVYGGVMSVVPDQLKDLIATSHFIVPLAAPFVFVYFLVWLAVTIFNMLERS